jgi:dimethylargininase
LEKAGLDVTILEPDERFPDSCFVEDTAVLNEKVAIIDRPGAISRQGEPYEIEIALRQFYSLQQIEKIVEPGTLEGGDVMRIGATYYVGRSERTNTTGLHQFQLILQKYGFGCTKIALQDMLHLKTGVNYLGDNFLLVAGEFIENIHFEGFHKIIVEEDEGYAANCLRINDYILLPAGFPKLKAALEPLPFRLIELEMSEFQKLDGGLSCLSLRF